MIPVEELVFILAKIWIQDEIFTLFKPQIAYRVDPHMPYIKVKL